MSNEVRKRRKPEGTDSSRSSRERFHLYKLTPDKLLKLHSVDSGSSSDCEEGPSDCWTVSKSPMKKSSSVKANITFDYKDPKTLFVSPVKLKRKSDYVKVEPSIQEESVHIDLTKDVEEINDVGNMKRNVLNSPESKRNLKIQIANANVKNNQCESSKMSFSPFKENIMKKKLSDSESDGSCIALDNVNCIVSNKTPKKILKIEKNRELKIVLDKLDTEIGQNVVKSIMIKQEPMKILRSINTDNELAIPLDLLDKKTQNKGNSKEKINETRRDNDVHKLSEITDESDLEVFKSPKKSSRKKKSTPSFRRQNNLRNVDSSVNYREFSESSEDLISDIENMKIKTPISKKGKARVRTPSIKRVLNIDKNNLSSNKSDSSDESSSNLSISSRSTRSSARCSSAVVKKVEKKTPSNVRSTRSSHLESPKASPDRISLRKRSDIKRPWSDDFEFTDVRSPSAKSPRTPTTKLVKSKDECKSSGKEGTSNSPRVSRRLQDAKKSPSVKEEPLSRTPRSVSNRNLSPLVDSIERISLRNRSDIKKPWAEDLDLDIGKRLSLANSPRTPSHSLRKQVLESTTRSAKKKLVMGSDSNSSEDEEELTYRRRSTRNKRSGSSAPSNTPANTPVHSPSKTPVKKTPSKSTTTPTKGTPKGKNQPTTPCTPTTVRRVGQGFLTPVVEERSVSRHKSTKMEDLRLKLHVSTVPTSLPCRLNESNSIKSFISCKIKDKTGGCMYISGVPGTGKTATVHAVVKTLQQKAIDKKLSPFDFVEVNGLRLNEARQAYVRIWQSLSGSKVSSEQAFHNLEKKFSSRPSRPTVLLVDELDYVCNLRQDVIYNILDWSTKKNARLIVLTIANTMDLPDRTLRGKVTSRMGLTRLVFQPYTFQQLQEIVMNRIEGSSNFDPDAVQFVARKVAAVSGDARRALDICRRATELLDPKEKLVTLKHVDQTLKQIYLSRRVQAIKHCSFMTQLLLRSIRDETLRTGLEETTVQDVYSHLCALCNLEGSWEPNVGQVLSLCRTLSSSDLISMEKGRQDILSKLTLNVSSDDIHYALSN